LQTEGLTNLFERRTIMIENKKTVSMPKLIYLGFTAGFFSALVFKQMILWVLWQLGLAQLGPYIFTATPPLDIHAARGLGGSFRTGAVQFCSERVRVLAHGFRVRCCFAFPGRFFNHHPPGS
jgi:hypothetical protein